MRVFEREFVARISGTERLTEESENDLEALNKQFSANTHTRQHVTCAVRAWYFSDLTVRLQGSGFRDGLVVTATCQRAITCVALSELGCQTTARDDGHGTSAVTVTVSEKCRSR